VRERELGQGEGESSTSVFIGRERGEEEGVGEDRPVASITIKTPIMASVSIDEEGMGGRERKGRSRPFLARGKLERARAGVGAARQPSGAAARPGKKGHPNGWAPRVSERGRREEVGTTADGPWWAGFGHG
jgi:hypothetical protein